MKKLYNSILIQVLDFKIQMAITDKLFLAISFALLIKFSQIFAVKYLLLIYLHSGDRFSVTLALLFLQTIALVFY